MKANEPEKGDLEMSGLLRQARTGPDLPPRFAENVWRRIEAAEAAAPQASWLEALAGLVFRPKFALAALTVVVLAGVVAGTVQGRQVARHEAQMTYLAAVVPPGLK